MPLTPLQIFITLLMMAIGTFTVRVIPFLLFPEKRTPNKYVLYLGRALPFAIMGLLVVYCLKEVSVTTSPFGLPELISLIVIVALHVWKRNMFVSIGIGTALYMFLVQIIFV